MRRMTIWWRALMLAVVIVAAREVVHTIFMPQAERERLLTHLAFPPRGDLPSDTREQPLPTAMSWEDQVIVKTRREFERCGGSPSAVGLGADGEVLLARVIAFAQDGGLHRWLRQVSFFNSGWALREAQLCQWIGRCGLGLPASIKRPELPFDFDDPHTFMTAEEMEYAEIQAIGLACGQGRRSKEGLKIRTFNPPG